jgi:hypothetical protein
MTLSAAQIAGLNSMCGGSSAAVLGTAVSTLETSVAGMAVATGLKKGTATVSAAQASANLANISTGLATVTSWIVQVYRSGVNVTSDAVISAQTGGVLRVADGGSTYNMAESDVINYLAW